MHARIDQLLSLLDGSPVDVVVRDHVAACRECVAELDRVSALRDRLRALPPLAGAGAGWTAVEARLAERARRDRRLGTLSRAVAVASVAVLAVMAGLELTARREQPKFPVANGLALEVPDSVGELQTRSRMLEQALASLPARPAVERADVSVPIETLEAQVQWLDHRLSLVAASASDEEPEAARLWRDRVEVMNSLVWLRYAETQRTEM